MQLQELLKIFNFNQDLQLVEELFLLAQKFDKVDHFVKDFFILHLIDKFNLVNCQVNVNVHGQNPIPINFISFSLLAS